MPPTDVSEFTIDIRHVPGEDNPIAVALSKVDSIMMLVIFDTEELAQQQTADKELLRELESPSSSLKLQKFLLPETKSSLYCDCSQNNVRPVVPAILRRRIFDMVHGLSRPRGRTTRRQITQIFVWTSINKDLTAWAKACLHCHRSKLALCHITQSLNSGKTPDSRCSFRPRSLRSSRTTSILA